MDISSLLLSMLSMGALGAFFSIGLAVANKTLKVEENPLISKLVDLLPGANCGGCGYPGCGNFAEHVILEDCEINECPVSDADSISEMAELLGVDVVAGEKEYPIIMCQGGNVEAAKRGIYQGIKSCVGARVIGGADKACDYGCYGFADCVNACPFGALTMNENGLPVLDESLCTGCAKCKEACPQAIIEMHPKENHIFVLCKNHDNPKDSRRICTKACIGCGICVRAATNKEIVMDDFLAIMNHYKVTDATDIPYTKCPTKSIISTRIENE